MKRIPCNNLCSAILLIICFALTLPFNNMQAQHSAVNFYLKGGYLLNPPSPEDLGYRTVGSQVAIIDHQDVNGLNIGLGLKPYFPVRKGLQAGLDIGIQTLFNSRTDMERLPSTYYDYNIDKEWEVYINLLARYKSEYSPWFAEGGAGLHNVFWYWEHHYSSNLSNVDDYDNGSGQSFGLTAEAGRAFVIGPKFSIPVSVRGDLIFRYSTLFSLCLAVGFVF
jgi:hypothetical protein